MSNGGSRNPFPSLLHGALVLLLTAVCVNLTVRLLVAVWLPLTVVAVSVGLAAAVAGAAMAWWRRGNHW